MILHKQHYDQRRFCREAVMLGAERCWEASNGTYNMFATKQRTNCCYCMNSSVTVFNMCFTERKT